jgi:hypothetical protein
VGLSLSSYSTSAETRRNQSWTDYVDGRLEYLGSRCLRSVAEPGLQGCDVISNLWCQLHRFLHIFGMMYTCIQRFCQKPVWSVDHTALSVAPPLFEVEGRDDYVLVVVSNDPIFFQNNINSHVSKKYDVVRAFEPKFL